MRHCFFACLGLLIAVLAPAALAQSADSLQFADVGQLAAIPAVAGYEQELSGRIREQLKALAPETDNLGNVYVTVGSGAPRPLLVTAIDEPGYVVREITPDGFLRAPPLAPAPPSAGL